MGFIPLLAPETVIPPPPPLPPGPVPVGRAVVRTIVHLSVSGTQLGEVVPGDFSFGLYLDRPSSVAYTIPVGHKLCNINFTDPYSTDFAYYRNDQTLLAGLHTGAEIGLEGNDLQVAGQDWKHYFEKRIMPFEPSDPAKYAFAYVQEDSLVVLRELLDMILGLGPAPAFSYNLGTSGTLVNLNIEPGDSTDILGHINQLSSERPGFDFVIDPDRTIRAYPGKKGSTINYTLEKNKNVSNIGLANQGRGATHVLGFGAGLANKLAALRIADTIPRRYDHAEDYGDVIDQQILNRLTDAELDRQIDPELGLVITVTPDAADDIWDNLALGDSLSVYGDVQGYLVVDGLYRIIAIEGMVNDQGDEILTLTTEGRSDA